MRKAIILTVLVISITGFAAAQDADVTIDGPPAAAWGGDGVDFDIHCEGSDCAATAADRYAEVCGAERGAASASGTDGDVTYHFENVKPQVSNGDIPCTIGDEYDITFIDKGFGWEHTLENVYSVKGNSMNSHVGQNIIVNYDIDNSELRNFMLTDDVWNTNPSPSEEPVIMLQEYDTFSDRGYVSLALADGETADKPILKPGMSITDFVHLDSVKEVESEYDANALDDKTASDVEGIELPKVNNWVYGDVEGKWGIDSQSPIHEGGDYNLGGDIALGYYPEYYDSSGNKMDKSGEGPYFFVCRSGAIMDNGFSEIPPPQVVNLNNPNQADSSNLYKCDLGEGEWRQTYECSDNLNNDGDTVIDLNDPECDGDSTRNAEEYQCDKPRIGKLAESYTKDGKTYESGTKVAFYTKLSGSKDYTDSVSGCSYNAFDVEPYYQGEQPELFRCNKDGSLEGYGSTDSEDSGNAVAEDGAEKFCTDLSEIVNDVDWNAHNDQMAVVEYFVPKEAIPVGPNRFSSGHPSPAFKNKFYTTLRSAEDQHMTTAPSAHDVEAWGPLGMIELGDGYNAEGDNNGAFSSSYSDYMDSWTIANATATGNDKIDSEPGTVDNEEVFNGGFGGRCPPDQKWQYVTDSSKWECQGFGEGWEQQVFFPNTQYDARNLSVSSGETFTAGFYIMPYVVNDVSSISIISLKQILNSGDVSSGSMTQIHAACWSGQMEDKPSDLNSDHAFTQKIELDKNDFDDPVPVTGDLALRSGENQYACEWGFKMENGNFYNETGYAKKLSSPTFVDLFESREYSTPEGKDERVFSGSNSIDSGNFAEFADHWKDNVGVYTQGADINDKIDED